MQESQRIQKLVSVLNKTYASQKLGLRRSNPIQLLVAVILSAQCTDIRVNQVTESLFKKYKTAKDFASANSKIFEKEIFSTGFYKNKAKNIRAACKIIYEQHNGKLPNTMPELLNFPGVARKTANVVLGEVFGQVEGFVVDTHVKRLSQRMGLTQNVNPEKIEKDLMQKISPKDWWNFSTALILHGRKICQARKPRCLECPVQKLCPSAVVFFPELKLAKQ
ncbi:MAG: endonuclease III [Candidatus Diapherotrites archaeon]|nr:endonuclease III [Candidatus Diapherotrites archaeon]